MKRRGLILFLTALTGAALLSGCGKKTEPEKEESVTELSVGEEPEETAEEEAAESVESAQEEASSGESAAADQEAEALFTDGSQTEAGAEDFSSGLHHVEIEVENYGVIKAELDADTAPITTANFLKLAKEGFYDGLTFHRIIDGFMIQGGDPEGTGNGGSDETIVGEFSDNGIENDISHVRGTISMARRSDPDSASSQFFIVQADSTFLDHQYAGFGTVTEGMEVVDQICRDARPIDGNGTIEAGQQPVIASVKVID